MDDRSLLRYSRHILLPQIGIEGQQRLNQSRVMIVGLGGLGSPVALYLAASGVGELILVDDDRVELSNLQRQIIHHQADIGQYKAVSAARHIADLNPECRTEMITSRFNENELIDRLKSCHLILDCTDNFATRFMINRASLASGTPLVSAAAIRWEGQIAVFNRQQTSACYRCLYDDNAHTDQSCANNGVAAPSVGAIGCLQANEALKLLLGLDSILDSQLLLVDLFSMQFRRLNIHKDPQCPQCQK